MPQPLTREQLDQAHCSTPGCTHGDHGPLYLHGRCHPNAATQAVYENGVLTITCARCQKVVTQVAVAP